MVVRSGCYSRPAHGLCITRAGGFLVFVVMAVQYESLRNPLVILLGIPFTSIGVAAGIYWLSLPISMPVWLGMIMLARYRGE